MERTGDKYIYSLGYVELPPFIEEEGTLDVTLVEKVWGKSNSLICVFQKEDGTTFSTTAWRRRASDTYPEHYAPRKTDIDFADISKGTKWRCAFAYTSRSQYINWMTAEKL
jgi:hypothetical protein